MNIQSHRQTDKRTDRKLKTEGTKTLSRDISHLQTVVIGGPKTDNFKEINNHQTELTELRFVL